MLAKDKASYLAIIHCSTTRLQSSQIKIIERKWKCVVWFDWFSFPYRLLLLYYPSSVSIAIILLSSCDPVRSSYRVVSFLAVGFLHGLLSICVCVRNFQYGTQTRDNDTSNSFLIFTTFPTNCQWMNERSHFLSLYATGKIVPVTRLFSHKYQYTFCL
jgi:hypothetical protein